MNQPARLLPGHLALTLLVPLALFFGESLILPGIDVSPLRNSGLRDNDSLAHLSIFALGINPLLTAFSLVEILALAVPRWRALRWSLPAGRQRLDRAAYVLTVVCAVIQSYFLARWLNGAGFQVVTNPGHLFELLTVVTLTAGTCAMIVLCHFAGRYGLGNGFSILLGWGALHSLLGSGRSVFWATQTGELPAGRLLLSGLVVGLTVAITVRVLRARPDTDPLRLPGCGLVPLQVAAGLLLFPHQLASFFGDSGGLIQRLALAPGTGAYLGLQLLLTAALGWVIFRLFHLQTHLRHVGAAVDPAELLGALLRSVGFLLALLVLQFTVDRVLPSRIDLASVVLCTAVGLDLFGEWRFRRAQGDVVPLFGVHHLYAVGPLLSALAQSGIAARLRGACHRTLLQFGGPFLPVSFLVPAEQAAQAEQVLRSAWPESAPRLPRPLAIAATLGPLLLLALMAGIGVFISFGPPSRPQIPVQTQAQPAASEECIQRCRTLEQQGALQEGIDAAACITQLCR